MKGKLIWFILAVGFLLRIVSVGDFPMGLNADETSFGYDAYSILNTGRDQWGNKFPIVLKSFGDFKSPVYSYLAVPSVAVLGLNTVATRLPNVIVGTLAVLVVYLLLAEIGKYAKWLDGQMVKWLPLVAAGLLATNPWSVMMSRGALEANLISLFLPLGILLFLKGLNNYKYFTWSALSFGIGMFTYHSAKVLIPVVVIGLLFIFRSQSSKIQWKTKLVPLAVLAIFMIGMIYTFQIGGGSRISERSITQGALEQGFDERVKVEANGTNPKIAKILHNRYQVIVKRFITNYTQYFSPKYLIVNGAGDATYTLIPGIGMIYFLEFILLLGIIPLFLVNKDIRKILVVLLLWLLVTPIPAALASGAGYSGNRASGMIPVLQIIEAFGLFGWFMIANKLSKNFIKYLSIVFAVLLFLEVLGFINSYFKTQPTRILAQEGYGYVEMAKWLKDNTVGRKVFISRSVSEAQIFLAYSQVWEPTDFQKATKTWGFDEANVPWVDQLPKYSLGNYTITSIDWKSNELTDSIVVVKADELPKDKIVIKTFYFPNGEANIVVIDEIGSVYAKK